MLRILLAIMVMTFLFAILAVWAIFEFDLLMVKGPEFVSRREAEPKLARSRLSRGRVVRRAPPPGAIPAYDLTGRSFGRSPLPLSLPIDCEPGVDCWVFNYVDSDPGKGYADFACGRMSYDGHKGTDIALAHAGRLHERIEVRAAADGRVVGVRDGMSDLDVRLIGRAALKGKDCGNGVRVDHGEGWHTQYCHMKRGSVSVRRGGRVRAGERLGAVGLSGRTEFPHLHISVEKKGKVVDPFVGVGGGAECDLGENAALAARGSGEAALLIGHSLPSRLCGSSAHDGGGPHGRAWRQVASGLITRAGLLGRGRRAHAGRFYILAPPGSRRRGARPKRGIAQKTPYPYLAGRGKADEGALAARGIPGRGENHARNQGRPARGAAEHKGERVQGLKGEAEEGKCGIMRESVNGESGLIFCFRFRLTLWEEFGLSLQSEASASSSACRFLFLSVFDRCFGQYDIGVIRVIFYR